MRKNQNGIALPMILAGIAIIALIGGAVFFVMNRSGKDNASTPLASLSENKELREAAKLFEAECLKELDKDLCKFLANWKLTENYRMVTETSTADGTASYRLEQENKDRTSGVFTENGKETMAAITIGNTIYTKDVVANKWYKQTIKDTATNNAYSDFNFTEDLTSTIEQKEGPKPTYTFITKEACDNLTCFKYQIKDPESPNDTQYLWFDDKDYILRRMRLENADGNQEIKFTYGNVKVSEPADAIELKEGQQFIPGSGVIDMSDLGTPGAAGSIPAYDPSQDYQSMDTAEPDQNYTAPEE